MNKLFKYRCNSCGEEHEGAPSFSFNAPFYYQALTDDFQKSPKVSLDSDFCIIEEDRFIRVCLEIPIKGFDDPFMWGVWISLSQTNFEKYKENFKSNEEAMYFGWFSNKLPYYSDTLSLKTEVHVRQNGVRPYITLEHTDHPLCLDYHHGISWEKAAEIAQIAMHGSV